MTSHQPYLHPRPPHGAFRPPVKIGNSTAKASGALRTLTLADIARKHRRPEPAPPAFLARSEAEAAATEASRHGFQLGLMIGLASGGFGALLAFFLTGAGA